jgi:hypothetical protein
MILHDQLSNSQNFEWTNMSRDKNNVAMKF